jgi:hypothetical protein
MPDLKPASTTPDGQPERAHLWQPDHPYYCAAGNFYKVGCHNLADSWREFYDKVKSWDADMNLLFRWDWHEPGFGEWEGAAQLDTFWVGQRKAAMWSYTCPVTQADEPGVRAWLEERAKTIIALWAPISLAPPAAASSGTEGYEEGDAGPCCEPCCVAVALEAAVPARLPAAAEPASTAFAEPPPPGTDSEGGSDGLDAMQGDA